MIRFFYFLFFLYFSVSVADAAIYKGQKVFVKKCVSCHKAGQNFVAKYRIEEWEKWMKEDGEPLAKLHLDSKEAEASWQYFKSKKYGRKVKHLKQFLVEYAKDSGNVPACN